MVEKDWLVRETPGNIGKIKDTLFPLVPSAEMGSSKTVVSRSINELYDVNEVTILILTGLLSPASIGSLSK